MLRLLLALEDGVADLMEMLRLGEEMDFGDPLATTDGLTVAGPTVEPTMVLVALRVALLIVDFAVLDRFDPRTRHELTGRVRERVT